MTPCVIENKIFWNPWFNEQKTEYCKQQSIGMTDRHECTVVDKKNATLVVIPTHIIVEK